jgi:hypothetical protein
MYFRSVLEDRKKSKKSIKIVDLRGYRLENGLFIIRGSM